mmetsp:Transcript_18304/g.39566  ORF Transcript_18304/g.39566 Transcript_18304/m.39566 type:complete len:121 (-) Transcript_18304:115-477(-)
MVSPLWNEHDVPLHGTCTDPNPICILLLATTKINKLAPIKTYTNRIKNVPTETLVKNILPTNLVPNFSILRYDGNERSTRQKTGIGKNIHITWPHVIIEPAMLEICLYEFIYLLRMGEFR